MSREMTQGEQTATGAFAALGHHRTDGPSGSAGDGVVPLAEADLMATYWADLDALTARIEVNVRTNDTYRSEGNTRILRRMKAWYAIRISAPAPLPPVTAEDVEWVEWINKAAAYANEPTVTIGKVEAERVFRILAVLEWAAGMKGGAK